MPRPTVEERFWSKVDQTGDCWLWLASKWPTGYGAFGYQGKSVKAHRMAWFLVKGFWPLGDLDHQCRVRACVNPDHLREISHLEHVRDNGWSSRTHCPAGHEYTEANTIRYASHRGRKCRTCHQNRNRERRRKHGTAA